MDDVKSPERPRIAAEALTADDIVEAALSVLARDGLDAVSMRRVATELGVSPIPLYSRVGNKDALLDAMAAALVADVAEPPRAGEEWPAYAVRWCHGLRDRRRAVGDSRLLLRGWRESMVEATRPLIRLMRHDGVDTDRAVDAARLLMWSTLGHVAIELGHDHGDVDADRLFADHVTFVVAGLRDDLS